MDSITWICRTCRTNFFFFFYCQRQQMSYIYCHASKWPKVHTMWSRMCLYSSCSADRTPHFLEGIQSAALGCSHEKERSSNPSSSLTSAQLVNHGQMKWVWRLDCRFRKVTGMVRHVPNPTLETCGGGFPKLSVLSLTYTYSKSEPLQDLNV